MNKIYLAMAEYEDGNRIIGSAFRTRIAAESAAFEMVKDIRANTNWSVVPIVEDVDLVDE